MSKTINDSEKSDGAVDAPRGARVPRPSIFELGQLLPLNIRSLALTGIFIILLLYTLKIGSAFFIPVVLALLLSFVFASVIRLLSRFYVPAPLGAAIVLLALLGSLALGIYRLAEPAREWMAKLPETVRQVERKLKNVKQSVQEVTKATKEVDRLTSLDGGEKTQKVEVKRATLGESLLGSTQEFLVGTSLVFALLFFLLASGDLFLRKLVSVLPSFHDKKLAVEISHQIEQDVSRYLLAISCINAVFGAAVGGSMYLLGLPTPLLWGVMAGLLHFIPFLGAVVGISVVTMEALVTLDSMETIVLVPAVYLALNLLEEYLVSPWILGRRFLLNAVVVFLWLIFWGWLWGVPGALMAIPLLAILKIICDHIEPLGAIGEFLGP